MKLLSKIAAAAVLGLGAGPLLASNATCSLTDGNNFGWKAEVVIADYPSQPGVAIVSASVDHISGCYGAGLDFVDESSQELAYFNAGGSTHFFQTPYLSWGAFSEGPWNSCGAGLLIYAAFQADC